MKTANKINFHIIIKKTFKLNNLIAKVEISLELNSCRLKKMIALNKIQVHNSH